MSVYFFVVDYPDAQSIYVSSSKQLLEKEHRQQKRNDYLKVSSIYNLKKDYLLFVTPDKGPLSVEQVPAG